jgi:hypothetical protein
MTDGTQLSMEKRLYEQRIMKKALLTKLDKVFLIIGYCQLVIESNYESYPSMESLYAKVGQMIADAKFYFLSATFTLMKQLDDFNGVTLQDHMEANRPPEKGVSTPITPLMTIQLIDSLKETAKVAKLGYNKYETKKFKEYYGYFTDKLTEISKTIEQYVVQSNQ